jgi:hypothetical protein
MNWRDQAVAMRRKPDNIQVAEEQEVEWDNRRDQINEPEGENYIHNKTHLLGSRKKTMEGADTTFTV